MADTKTFQPDLGFVKGVMEAGGDTVNRCYQCATCSVVCPLSTEESPFPRKEMLWAQWGMADRIAGDADVWLCHQCGDCSTYCPRDAKPGDVLGAIRANAIKYYAQPKALADLFSNKAGVLAVVGASYIAWLIVIFLWSLYTGERFLFPEGDVKYYKLLTFIPIDALALPAAGIAAWAGYMGITAFWRDLCKGSGYVSYSGTPVKPAIGPFIFKYIIPAFQEILAHSRFEKCGQTRERVQGHKLMLYSFIILFIVTCIVFVVNDMIYVPFLGHHFTPMPLWNPIKIAANIGAVMLVAGSWMVWQMRKRKTEEGVFKSSEQDWLLIYLIFAVGVTGVAAEVIRLFNIALLAYPIYVLHLATVVTLFLSIPYSKFAHLLYRTTAYVFQLYEKDLKEGKAGWGMEKEVLPPNPEEAEKAAH